MVYIYNMEDKYQYAKDFIILSIIDNKNTNKIDINEYLLPNLILVNFKKIIEEIILSGQYDIISVLVEYYKIDKKFIINNLINVQYINYNRIVKFETIEWIYKNDYEFFKEYTCVLFENSLNLLNIFNNNYKILKLFYEIIIKSNTENFVKYKSIFIGSTNKFMFNQINYNINHEFNKNIYSNIEHLILLTDISICDESNYEKRNMTIYQILYKIIVSEYSDLKLLKKFISNYNLLSKELKLKLENKDISFINNLINSKSYDKINWFFDVVKEYTKFIKNCNYINLFENACKTSDVKIARYFYELIQLCGFEITNQNIIGILDRMIYSSRWNKSTEKQKIICELINLGVKPPNGYPIYTEYYNNLRIIKK